MFSNKVDSIQLPLSFEGEIYKVSFQYRDVFKMIDISFKTFSYEEVVLHYMYGCCYYCFDGATMASTCHAFKWFLGIFG